AAPDAVRGGFSLRRIQRPRRAFKSTSSSRRPVMIPNRPRPALAVAAAAVISAGALGACAYNETLGRNQLLLVDDSALAQAAASAWTQALAGDDISRDAAQNERVRRVGGRIVQAAGLGGQNWEYAVFRNE